MSHASAVLGLRDLIGVVRLLHQSGGGRRIGGGSSGSDSSASVRRGVGEVEERAGSGGLGAREGRGKGGRTVGSGGKSSEEGDLGQKLPAITVNQGKKFVGPLHYRRRKRE